MPSQQEQPETTGRAYVHDAYVHEYFNEPGPYALPEPPEEDRESATPSRPGSGAVGGVARTARTLFATGLTIVLTTALGASMAFASAPPRELLVSDSFDRPNAAAWGDADSGKTWMNPTGRDGFALSGGMGTMRVSGRGQSQMTVLNTNVGHVTMQYDFSIDKLPGGPGVKVMAVLRKSKAGSYRVRVRVGRQGRIWLSVAKTRGRGTATIIGQPVLIDGWRYRAGQQVTVRAQAIKQDPTQLRVKVWPSGGTPPSGWQLVRNDLGADIGSPGRVGLRAQITKRAYSPSAMIRFDNVTVNRAQDAVLANTTPVIARKPQTAPDKRPPSERDNAGPRILEVGTTEITQTSAKVRWKLDEPAAGFVKYGETRAYGSQTTVEDSYEHATHLRSIGPLDPGTTYHYKVVSEDAAGNRTTSGDLTFTTAAADAPPPDAQPTATPAPTSPPQADPTAAPAQPALAITNIGVGDVGERTATITWSLNRPATGVVQYGLTHSYGSRTVKETSFDYSTHTQRLTDLAPDTLYHFQVVSEDAAGNRTTSGDLTFTTAAADAPPPDAQPTATPAPTSPPQADPTAAPAQPALAITNIGVGDVGERTATITWSLNRPATGVVQYGLTDSYGSRTVKETSFDYSTHTQRLTDLAPDTLYHFQVVSEDAAGNRTTSGDLTVRTRAVATPSPTPTPAATAAPQPPASGEVYGAGVAIDSKSNFRIGVDAPKLSHRFRASTSSELLSVAWQRRLGSGYSAGDGGIARISVQSDDGNGRPSGQVLASLRYDVPASPAAGVLVKNTFPTPARLSAGTLYHIVWENVHADPQNNHFSVNDLFTWAATQPRQPAVSQDYAVLNSRSGWSVDARHTADMDLVYADGTHDGLAYIGILGDNYALIGGTRMVRERFTVSGGDRTVSEAYVRVGKQSGGAALVIRLEDASGTVLEQGTVPATQIPTWTPGDFWSANGAWVGFTFDRARTLRNGQTYRLVVSSPAGTQFSAVPIHHTQDNTTDASGDPLRTRVRSWAFRDGVAERSTDGGQSWSAIYQWSPNNLQFYLR